MNKYVSAKLILKKGCVRVYCVGLAEDKDDYGQEKDSFFHTWICKYR